MDKLNELRKELEVVRQKLNLLIEKGASKEEIYAVSLELDKLTNKAQELMKNK